MDHKLYPEWRTIYSLNWGHCNVIRLRIRMRDLVEPDALRHAVDQTMARYPYFCVQLTKDEDYYLAPNERPVVISHSLNGVTLNTAEANYHLVSFSYFDNWIVFDISHAITDGTGAYEVVRTLLYYYVSERYGVKLSDEGIRLAGEVIPEAEWEDPLARAALPAPGGGQMAKGFNPIKAAGLENDTQQTVYSVAVSESEFMRFNIQNDGSPATMVALFLSRAFHRLFPQDPDVIRIALALNLRPALHAPLAHQNLVGGVMLEYKPAMQAWPLDRQATAYRGMVFVQSMEEIALAGLANQNALVQMILSKPSDAERAAAAQMVDQMTTGLISSTVSYVGKANYREAEKYIRDFRTWTRSTGEAILIEISAVNGRFNLDFLQPFADPLYVNAFLRELDDNGIVYDLQDVRKLEVPDVALPWKQ